VPVGGRALPGPRGHDDSLGRALAVGAACMFGTQGVLAYWFAVAGGRTATLLALRFITGGIVFGAVAITTRIRPPRPRYMAGAALTGLAHVGFSTCLLRGFATSSVALTVLLFYTYPLFVTLGAAVLYGEPLTRTRIALVLVGTLGVGLAVGSPSGATSSGVLFGLGAGVGCTMVVLGNRALLGHGLSVPELAAVSYFAPTVTLIVLAVAGVVPAPPRTLDAWAPALAYVSFASVIPFWLFYAAVRRIGASLASLLATLEPLVGVLTAWLLIDQPLAFEQIVGGALILSAVGVLSVRGAPRPVAPSPASATRHIA
jgi:drug/metabolite transporter (DMT)-like permease